MSCHEMHYWFAIACGAVAMVSMGIGYVLVQWDNIATRYAILQDQHDALQDEFDREFGRRATGANDNDDAIDF